MNKRHYEHTLPNIRGSLSNTYDGFWAMKEKSMKSAILNFLSLFPTRTIRLPLWTKDFPLP